MAAKRKSFDNEPLEPLIFTIRGHRVMLDADLATLYGVGTKVLNQAVKRNFGRFPGDFAFQLTKEDMLNWSQFATTSSQHANSKREMSNRSQIVTGSQKHRDPRSRPWVFTEHGALAARFLPPVSVVA